MPYDATLSKPVTLPYDGSIGGFVTTLLRDGLLFSEESWTHPQLWYGYDNGTGRVTDTGLRPLSPVDYSAITSEEVRVRATDGTMVPLSIVHRRDAKRDGSNPTFLDGYGSYGITYDPSFDPRQLAWFEHGGVYACVTCVAVASSARDGIKRRARRRSSTRGATSSPAVSTWSRRSGPRPRGSRAAARAPAASKSAWR